MTSPDVYLKDNVVIEPLVNQWYAWAYLIPPITWSLYLANWQLKIMRSYVTAPQLHRSAAKTRSLMGGPFVDYESDRTSEMKDLIERTVKEYGHLLDVAKAVKELNELLRTEATGYALRALYQQVPLALKGYVELMYDANHHPAIRFIEGLVYKSRLYTPSSQSMAIWQMQSDSRPFAFSTPVLQWEGKLHVSKPFHDAAIDELCKMRTTPRSLESAADMLDLQGDQKQVLSTFVTTRPPLRCHRYAGDGVRIRYFGHACLLIESREVSILCDPFIGYKWHEAQDRYSWSDVPDSIDYVLITHLHQDHCVLETLLQLRHRVGAVVIPPSHGDGWLDPSLKLLLQTIGFRQVIELDEMESLRIGGGTITGIPFLGEHGDLNIQSKLAFLVSVGGKSILCGADSENLAPSLYEHLREAQCTVDVLFIGMECDGAPLSWVYGPLLMGPLPQKMDVSRRFIGSDFHAAMHLVLALRPSHIYVYALGQEPWVRFITALQPREDCLSIIESTKLIEYARAKGITAERLETRKELII
jgi:L-ascorbate metabolism protein UlaG (beta-lactamase superfamily)